MRKNLGLIAIIAVVIMVVAISGCSNNQGNNNTSDKGTKVAVYNNGSTWLSVELDTNATAKNGTNTSIYAVTYIKPNGTAIVDFSNLLGYGNEPLPAGTTLRVQSWKGLFDASAGGSGTINLTFQGWSNTPKPGANDKTTSVNFAPVPIYQLPSIIKDTTVFTATSPDELAKKAPSVNADQRPVYEEEIITVNADGTVTITITKAPELCRAIASIV